MEKSKGQCDVCGATSQFKCGKCKKAYYCSEDCQKQHWTQGGHKKICGKDSSTDTCKRCLKLVATAGPVCQIPHPISSRRDGTLLILKYNIIIMNLITRWFSDEFY